MPVEETDGRLDRSVGKKEGADVAFAPNPDGMRKFLRFMRKIA